MFLRKSLVLVSVLFLVLSLSSCFWSGSDPAGSKKTGLVLVNVLDKEHFDDCRIKGSINIPFEQVEQDAPKLIDKDAEIVVYCSNYMCGASSAARDQLIGMGYKKVYAYEGGVAEWFQMGYPVEGPSKKAYLTRPSYAKASEGETALTGGRVGEEAGVSKVLIAEQLKKKLEESKKI